ncbi:MAG: radical SAM protein, partial [Candidatus Thorarchaeota archaeon]
MATFSQRILTETGSKLTGLSHEILQVNIGNRCNQLCTHCHVQATLDSEDFMTWNIMETILEVAEHIRPGLIDITGGAPELNPFLPRFLEALTERDYIIQVRTNLTVLLDSSKRGLMDLYRNLQIRLVGSFPCYIEADVDHVRGTGAFKKSIQVLKTLNKLGYGANSELELDLVFNPENASLPPNQAQLEE